MVLVPMSVAQSMYSRGASVPVASRQAPPVSHHPPLIPNEKIRHEREMEKIRRTVPVADHSPPIPNEKIFHEREMEDIRQASGVELGPGDSELNVPTASVTAFSSAAGQGRKG
ncbi:hypothetical protein BGZ92_002132 [Podila epicladia]|nr:hypothetical protein BGZ92_002132 [Podila epicladia]